jgi:hypothetical protein
MTGPEDLEKVKGWQSIGDRATTADNKAVGKALTAIGEAEVSGATVDADHIIGAGERGRAEGVDESGRRIINEKAPIEMLIATSAEREEWKEQGAPSKLTIFFRNLLAAMGITLKPMKRKPKTRHQYERRHDGYKRIHKL